MRIEEIPGPPPTALVANLPYNVSVPVLIHMLTLLPSLERGLVMVQAEVADRLAAGPGSKVYGIPSVKAAWFADVRRAGAIGRNVFWPAPNVDSGLVAWTRCDPPDTTATRAQVFTVIDAAFATAASRSARPCVRWPGRAKPPSSALAQAGIDPTARGEVLTVADFARIAEGMAVVTAPALPLSVSVRAAAKINLHLGVGAVRDDGFHPLDTVYQAISLYDDVTITRHHRTGARRSSAPTTSTPPTSPSAPHNIAVRALELIRARTGREGHEHLDLVKSIPVAGGMAGGSADAAATLLAFDRLHGAGLPDDVLLGLAAELGSDVPFSLIGGTARGRGRGEVVRARSTTAARWWWVAVPSDVGLSTPEVYRHFDRALPPRAGRARRAGRPAVRAGER